MTTGLSKSPTTHLQNLTLLFNSQDDDVEPTIALLLHTADCSSEQQLIPTDSSSVRDAINKEAQVC